jgi:hypothetical protein
MGIREEFDKLREKADLAEDDAQAHMEGWWASSPGTVVVVGILLLVLIALIVRGCTA